jgi:hypothetical protein
MKCRLLAFALTGIICIPAANYAYDWLFAIPPWDAAKQFTVWFTAVLSYGLGALGQRDA